MKYYEKKVVANDAAKQTTTAHLQSLNIMNTRTCVDK